MAKIFAVAKQPQEFHGIIIPAGAIYGKVTLNYSVKVPTGKTRQIYDKDGYPLFNEDGSPIIRNVLRIEQRSETFIYAITDFKRVNFKDGAYYRAWVMIPRNEYAKMHERVLCETAGLRELQKFIMQKILKSGIKMDVQEIGQNGKIRKMAQSAAPRRKVQTADDMPFRGHACYALNANVMTDSNLDKPTMGKSVIASHKGAFNGKHGEEAGKPYVSPVGKKSVKMVGNEPTFKKFIETPTGIRRFYNEQEYNDYMAATAVMNH